MVGVALLGGHLGRLRDVVTLPRRLPRPDRALLAQLLRIGLPAGGEFVIMVALNSVIYALIRGFGGDAQAGFGIAGRVMQSLAMPAMALSFAIPAVAGQNFGAGRPERVRETLKQALLLEAVVMAVIVAACQLWASVPVGWFTDDARTAQAAITVLRVVSWNFFAAGIV